MARHRHGRVISFVQVFSSAFNGGRWVTIGLGTADAAGDHAAGMIQRALSAGGGQPVCVRVSNESNLSPAELEQAHDDIEGQA